MTAPNLPAFEAALAGLAADLGDLAAPVANVARTTVAAAAAAAPKRSGAMAVGPPGRAAAATRARSHDHGRPPSTPPPSIGGGGRMASPANRGWWRCGAATGGWPAKFVDDLQAIIDKEAART